MMVFMPAVLLLLFFRADSSVIRPSSRFESSKSLGARPSLPAPDNMLHIYVLPVGQGDSHVIQCPNGDLSIVDLGTSSEEADGFWFTNETTAFLAENFGRIRNVILTHNHFDYYSLIPSVLTHSHNLNNFTNFYMSCSLKEMAYPIKTWIKDIHAEDKIRMFNAGQPRGPTGTPCDRLDLCPGDPDVQIVVMAANLNHCNMSSNKNIDSLVFKIIHNDVTIMFNGDFEDETSDQNENGWQKTMADYYGSELEVTVYKISHHGAQNLANKRVSCFSHKPKAVFVSGDTRYSYRHPRCDVLDRFIDEVGSLCKPLIANSNDPKFCSKHPHRCVSPSDRIQKVYTCGENSTSINGGIRKALDNEYAIYTTVPDESNLNIIKFSSNGTRWGFINNIYPKRRNTTIVF